MPPISTASKNSPHPVKLFNTDIEHVTHRDAVKFIDAVYRQHQQGYGFVPLIGSGFSVSAGIPIIKQVHTYLCRCIYNALGIDSERDSWDPATDRWPPFIDPKGLDWNEICQAIFDQLSVSDQDKGLLQEAFGAMAEWRTSLAFLSRLQGARRSGTNWSGPVRRSLGPPRQETIDSCFRELIRNKRPSVNHAMLAVLSMLLRIDMVLTTNFDDLLEQAFASSRDSLQPFEVHLGEPLPAWATLSRIRSVVKLHGNRHLLRADYSLNADPSALDKDTFAEYLLGCPLAEQEEKGKTKFRNHLLVMGCSADEPRTLRLIDHACKVIPRLRVFWTCYSEKDIKALQDVDRQSLPHVARQLRLLRYTEPGLLLLQLDQTIRKTLPPNGAIFPSVIRIPLPPLPSPGKKYEIIRQASDRYIKELFEKIESFDSQSFWGPLETDQLKLVVACSPANVSGVTSACADTFRRLESGHVALWIDMNDIDSTDHLFEILLEAAYHKLGREDWTPVYMGRDQRPRAREIRSLIDSTDKPWIVFLNARETPGSNRVANSENHNCPNGWLDNTSGPRRTALPWDDKSNRRGAFVELLLDVCGKRADRLSVVLMCHSQSPFLGPDDAFLKPYGAVLLPFSAAGTKKAAKGASSVTDRVVQWTASTSSALERRRRQRFVHALVLMQRPRMLAVLWDDCLRLDRSISDQRKEEWLTALEERGLLRRNEGGIIWMHAKHRNSIRECLTPDPPKSLQARTREVLEEWSDRGEDAEIHALIAHWYAKMLDATSATPAIFEAVDHLTRATRGILRDIADAPKLSIEKAQQAFLYLETAHGLLWSNHFLIRTSGYAVSSCRRLLVIRDMLGNQEMIDILRRLKDKSGSARDKDRGLASLIDSQFAATIENIQKLLVWIQINSVELIREISREAGEDGKAYQYHREIRARLINAPEILSLAQISRSNDDKSGYHSKALADALQKEFTFGLNQDPRDANQRFWVRWWRNCAALAISTRSFDQAESSLSRALLAIHQKPIQFDEPRKDRRLPDAPGIDEVNSWLKDKGMPLRLEALRVIEKSASLLLLRDSLAHRLASVDPARRTSPAATHKMLKQAEKFIKCGLELADQIRLTDHSRNGHIAGEAAWFKAHLLLHRSLVCLSLDPRDRHLPKAMGLIDDAQACLTNADNPRNHAALAYVELHRAEVRLRQAAEFSGVAAPRSSAGSRAVSISRWSLTFFDCREGETLEARKQRWSREVKNYFARRAAVRTVVPMKAMDAMRFLDRAEPILHERRRNVWWSTWYFERRLDAIALTLWATVDSKEGPIPFLGLEAAADWADTEADTLLKDTVRMVRIDTYRLATVILSYSLCIRALQVRMAVNHTPIRHSHRLESMNRYLGEALSELENASRRRADAVSHDPKYKKLKTPDERDQGLQYFVECVSALAHRLHSSLSLEVRDLRAGL